MTEVDLDNLLEGLPDQPVEQSTPAPSLAKTTGDKQEEEQPAVRRGRKEGTVLETPLVSYTGPLQVFTVNGFKFPEGYSSTVLAFKEFIDRLGSDGVTFEYLFAEADKAFKAGVAEAEVSKIKQKFTAINSRNVLTLKSMELICGLLGYEPTISFVKKAVDPMNLEENTQQLD